MIELALASLLGCSRPTPQAQPPATGPAPSRDETAPSQRDDKAPLEIDGHPIHDASAAVDPDVKVAWEAFVAIPDVATRTRRAQAEHPTCQPRIDEWAEHPTLRDYELLDAVRRLAAAGAVNVLSSVHTSMRVVIESDEQLEQLFIGLVLANLSAPCLETTNSTRHGTR